MGLFVRCGGQPWSRNTVDEPDEARRSRSGNDDCSDVQFSDSFPDSHQTHKMVRDFSFLASIARISAASFIMGVFLVLMREFGLWSQGINWENLAVLLACVMGGVGVYGICAYFLKCEQMRSIKSVFRK